ncbi:hypothetical protein A3E73_01365 [Candidatus Beckwithbacteria bacterium RIFCSPHIGHO2_12_FULL_47_17]|uniref:Glycosyltransferase 2-like domain-containing protein n=1 Tax=Candidatus Beckwithbacteria bacterium RIFCSPHIGHO2_12_FULL_47_17 TaxID=1797460 RepID=A0A1F5DLF2_9BACT|nr:MAG: hypothetical protein A3E73_01365 [Candidatus Beckwithbacteria bacterium RIFCSPHIGHO2_12_FULL_47_17]
MRRNKHTSEVGTSFTSEVKLTVSIVSYNTLDLLKRCLASIYQFTQGLSFEVIVIDNASTDGSAQMVERNFPKVKLIKNKANRWYTGANNQALRTAKGKYFLILNSDIFLKNNAGKTMVEYLDKNPRVGALEPLQFYENGRVVKTGSRHNRIWWDLTELTLLHRVFSPRPYFRMSHFNRRKIFKAEVICDAVMLVRTALLKKINGYDEKLKLYYTENDLCRQIQNRGFTTVHLGKASVWHRVSASTDKAGWKVISKIYAADAKAYYLKYHSLLAANLLYWSMGLNNFLIRGKVVWPWLSLVALATILRFYRLSETMTFIGDQGRDFLAARDMVTTGVWPLVGIASSVPWLHQGPVFIWLTALALKLGNFNPIAPAVMTAALGVLSVYLLYRWSKNWWAGLILAASPLAVVQSRLAYHTSPIPLVTLGWLWAMSRGSVAWAFFLAGLLLQFELTTLPLTILAIYWFKKFSPVWLIPFIPKIIYDWSHGFTQTLGFGVWAGYRLVNVFHWGNASPAIFEFWTKYISWGYPAIAGLVGLWLLFKLRRQSKLLLFVLGLTLISFYIHGSPSEAYFPVLFPIWAVLLPKPRRIWAKLALLSLVVFNVINLVKHDFYPYGPTLKQRLELVDQLPPNVKLVDYFGNPNFASDYDNYRYLLWWRGQEYDY